MLNRTLNHTFAQMFDRMSIESKLKFGDQKHSFLLWTMPSSRPLRIGLVGAGTVGGGVYELVMGRLRDRKGKRPLLITKICVKDLSKPRSFHLDDSITRMTTNVDKCEK